MCLLSQSVCAATGETSRRCLSARMESAGVDASEGVRCGRLEGFEGERYAAAGAGAPGCRKRAARRGAGGRISDPLFLPPRLPRGPKITWTEYLFKRESVEKRYGASSTVVELGQVQRVVLGGEATSGGPRTTMQTFSSHLCRRAKGGQQEVDENFHCSAGFMSSLPATSSQPYPIAVVFGAIQPAFYLDFAWLYDYERGRTTRWLSGESDASLQPFNTASGSMVLPDEDALEEGRIALPTPAPVADNASA
ncbi:hypothetical protein C8R45DRAFT_943689 [Mycena sanguinolenta]|nr:hypothetical protein C8R45DRAFT_943689 [Mycena sanguinolenta]